MDKSSKTYSGPAALILLESLLVHLVERDLLAPEELDDIVAVAIESQKQALFDSKDPAHHEIITVLDRVARGRANIF